MSNLNDFVIENGVLKKYKGKDSEVTIPNSVTEIGGSAFFGLHNSFKHHNPRWHEKDWRVGIRWLHISKKHHHPRRREKDWRLGVLWLQKT